jgi:hypothetical protein
MTDSTPILVTALSERDAEAAREAAHVHLRHGRFAESAVFRHVFETVVKRCMTEGLVGGDGLAADASLLEVDANRQRGVPGTEWRTPEAASRSMREYLAVLDQSDWGRATDVVPKFVSPADPAAQWTGAMRGPAFFAYVDNYLIDVKAVLCLAACR